MSNIKCFLLLSTLTLAIPFISFAEETLTITTYYPSPYGVYREMRSQRMAIGGTYFDNANYLWEELDGDGGIIDYLADLVVEGNVGIGTTEPKAKLHLYEANTVSRTSVQDLLYLATHHASAGYNGFGTGIVDFRRTYKNSTPHAINRISFIERGNSANDFGGAITFATKTLSSGSAEPAERMRIDYSGNVGIGSTAPASKLDVFDPTTATFRVGVDSTHRFLVSAGPGTTTVSSGKNQIEFTTTDTNIYFTAGGSGGLYLATGGTSWTGNSDIRLKKNITTISNALKKLNNIRGVNFNWVSASSSPSPQIGVIAQEVQKEFPELIRVDKNGYLGVQYDKFAPILIEAIKEQQNQIDALAQKLAALEAKLNPKE